MKTHDELVAYFRNRPLIRIKTARDNLRRHGVTNAQIQAARDAAGLPAIDGKLRHLPSPFAPLPQFGVISPRKPLAALLAQFDDVKKVATAMKALPKDSYLEDEEMRRNLHIATDRWRSVIQSPKLSAFQFELPSRKRVWLHAEAQQKLVAAINLSIQ